LRSSHGKIILVSSGAATGAYSTWGAYGSSKAAINHLAITLKAEEPLVTTIAIRPGVVDTEMQRGIRELHSTRMDEKDVKKFTGLFTDGELLKPEQPGDVMAKLALDAPVDLGGKFLRYVTLNMQMTGAKCVH
jgi:NAD(P)-dependent dehydrogenase (short-subunit alcohol dehydrogenase family)